jgi:S-DNA-T family DNA segregation ATPase FtsK/SpoIIIE
MKQQQLEALCDHLERALHTLGVPGTITGGVVGPRLIRLRLTPYAGTRYATITRVADDLALALSTPALRVDRDEQGILLEFPNPDPRPVRLQPLLSGLPPATVVLGLTPDGIPLLARLASPDVPHILVAGTTGSGKSVLLRSIAASWIVGARAAAHALLVVDPKGRLFPDGLDGLPHLLHPVTADMREAAALVRRLIRLMEERDARREHLPRVLFLVDELADLLIEGGSEIEEGLTRLAQRGREAGIHLVVATQRPSAAILTGLMRANFPLRLVGKVTSTHDATVAAGRGGTGAESLQGRGDFLAVGGAVEPLRFQGAHVTSHDLTEILVPHLRRRLTRRLTLPEVPIEPLPDWLEQGVRTLLEQADWWRRARGQWGAQKDAHDLLFPGKPYGGQFLERTKAIIEHAEREMGIEKTTTTTDRPSTLPLFPKPKAVAG